MDSLHVQNLLALPPAWSQYKGDRQSAVLCLIVRDLSDKKSLKLILTKRSTKVRSHRGQIGFPGGHREDEDNTPVDTALREAHEEIGLPPEVVQVMGSLPAVTSLKGKAVIPIVGLAEIDPRELIPCEMEVGSIIHAPIHHFLQSEVTDLNFKMFGINRHSYIYRYESHSIWGLTARMIQSAGFYLGSS
ncbi:NUDIX hydrolase [Pseudobacteriovorax antillogorgiicola]|uniref:NUDIX domain-containing protein n=2 Tax=Pseudobacteriovorax antillogorgiicola TaxID=1513793 RepID=A0A1Y6BWM5_9BACT|nr:CoA pyrophosphatase [Pseudobacteriovorax antillogorgiicola]TCS50229.1 NUDIX domain-containing protein [Pseudobacteriovorax antillogorgiicola]SMF32668.1 NUDIX domain-containing protein [Pseudobacteriovorax antillogorgiicola]